MSRSNKLLLCLWLCVPLAILISGIYVWWRAGERQKRWELDQKTDKVSQKEDPWEVFKEQQREFNRKLVTQIIAEHQPQPIPVESGTENQLEGLTRNELECMISNEVKKQLLLEQWHRELDNRFK